MAEKNKTLKDTAGRPGMAIKGAITKTEMTGGDLPLGHEYRGAPGGYCQALVAIMRDGRCGLTENAHG